MRFKNTHQCKVACFKNYHSLVFTKMVVQASQVSFDKQRLYSALSYLAHDKFITTQRCLIISNI